MFDVFFRFDSIRFHSISKRLCIERGPAHEPCAPTGRRMLSSSWMTVPSNSNCERPCFYCSLSRLQEQYSMHEIGSKACPQPFVKVGGYPCCQGPSHAWPFFWWSSFAACSHCPAGGGESESEAALPRQNPGPVIASASLRSQCRWHTIGFPSLSLSLFL